MMYVVIKTEDGSLHEASSMYQSQYEGNAAFAIGKCDEPFDPAYYWTVTDGVATKGNLIPVDQAAVDAFEAEAALHVYKDERKAAYPSIAEQLDMQYHDSVNGTTTWKDAIANVKSSIPKP
jgi:hypothetical protein